MTQRADYGPDPRATSALHDCSSTFGDAVDQIHKSLKEMSQVASAAESSTIEALRFQLSNVQTWMSAALTNEDTCTDGFEDVAECPVKDEVFDKIVIVKEYTSSLRGFHSSTHVCKSCQDCNVDIELGGLPESQSWNLFRNLAFKEGQEERDPHLTIVGKEIVKKCANVPLAIRTIAGLLYSQDTLKEWESFRDAKLRMMEQQENSVISTLKLSYIRLTPQLQQCFAYYTLFPKDYEK
uniref:Pectinesterase inhibitor domain-containing protein n=1 Tax=Chenopodium quinoa TaxID=63459 RepID=A0A803LJM2_CHEQI